jgi:uncharacterized small protein (DUF1192 family)
MTEPKANYKSLARSVMSPQEALQVIEDEAQKFGEAAVTLITFHEYRMREMETAIAAMQTQIDRLEAKVEAFNSGQRED